ncbi:MAG TPA: efflux RND transporter periplasmic adaptor subunit [Verrucomicrobiae bacterium]|nr:efflux RND transporter periplasmic adaptor subunit [Verrucomicrobiae bacterium]
MTTRTFMISLSALAVLSGCGRQAPNEPEAPPVRVQTIEVRLQQAPELYESAGTVRAKLTATVAAKVLATIQQVSVQPGEPVHKGQELAKLDNRDLRAEFERAKADFDRAKALLDSQAETPAEFDAVQSRYRVAAANLSYANITAPFDGVVGQKLCNAGDLASPGKPLFVVEQPTDFRLETQAPERFASLVHTGQAVRVAIDATGERCDGAVAEIDPVGDPSSHSFLVKIDLSCKQGLKSGMFGRAQLPVGEQPRLFVPRASVHEQGQLTFVYVAADGRANLRLVKTGKQHDDLIELLSGIDPGEQVVVSAGGELNDQQKITL